MTATTAITAATISTVRAMSRSATVTVSITAALAALDRDGPRDERYWSRAAATTTRITTMDKRQADSRADQALPTVGGQDDRSGEAQQSQYRQYHHQMVEESGETLEPGQLV